MTILEILKSSTSQARPSVRKLSFP